MARSKLTADEAREYSGSLAKAAAGDYELMDFAINTLGVPQALGMEPTEWVDSIGGYVRMGVEDRRTAVQQLKDDGRTIEQTATILGIGTSTVVADRRHTKALSDVAESEEQKQVGSGEKDNDVAEWTKKDIRDLMDEGKSDMDIALLTGLTRDTIRMHYRKPYEAEKKKDTGEAPQPKALTEGEAHSMLEGRLAGIELAALNLAAWWRQQGKEALAETDLGWVDETIAHTKEKVGMILDSVRGVDEDADAALAAWAKEAEGERGVTRHETKGDAVRSIMFDLMTVPGGFPGTVEDLAKATAATARKQINRKEIRVSKRVGKATYGDLEAGEFSCSRAEADGVLVGWRSPQHIEDHGWTVAYIGRGNESRYVIEEVDAAIVGPGSMSHKSDQVSDLIRTKAHIEFALDRTDGRSTEGKRYAKALAGIQVAIDSLLAVQ